MEKAEKVIQFKRMAPSIIRRKVQQYEYPVDDMQLPQSTQKSKYFTKESDVLLLVIADQLGYGNWREIKQAIRRDSRARFDHLLLSRSEVDLQRRLDILIKALEKEEAPAKKPTFEEVAGQMQRALEELRLAVAKALAEAEEQRALKRSHPKMQVKKPVSASRLAIEKQGSTVVVEDRSAPKGDESMVPGEDDIQMIDVEDKRDRSLGSSVQIDDDDEGTPRGNPEEERRRRLEQEANSLRIGYQRAMSDEDEDMEEHHKKRRTKSAKKTDDKLKQTKLAFTNLSGQKRRAEDSISSLSDQDEGGQQ